MSAPATAPSATPATAASVGAGGSASFKGKELTADFLAELKKAFSKNIVKVTYAYYHFLEDFTLGSQELAYCVLIVALKLTILTGFVDNLDCLCSFIM